jgi:hypothetical protein
MVSQARLGRGPLTDIARFRSDRFAPALPEDCQVNPGVYGFELAFWLASALVSEGVVTSYPESEDWGWFIEYADDSGAEFVVHCYNEDDSRDRWLLSLHRFGRKLFGRGKPPLSMAAPLVEAIRAVLENEPSIAELKWLFPDGQRREPWVS